MALNALHTITAKINTREGDSMTGQQGYIVSARKPPSN